MGACASKKTRAGKFDSSYRRGESAPNARAYKTINPATSAPTTNTKNSVSHTQTKFPRQCQTEKSRPENGGTTKHTAHKDAKVSSEANKKCIQQDNATCDIGIVENLNHSSKFTGAIRKPPAQSKLPDIKPDTIRSGNVTSPDDKGYSHETFVTAPYCSQAVAQRRLGENTGRTFDSKIYVNSQLDSKIFNVRALDFEKKSNACNDKAMKNNVAGPLLVQTHKGSEYKCGRANNRVTKICTTRKNCRNELYIDSSYRRGESVPNARAYKTINPATSVPTTNKKNSVSHTQTKFPRKCQTEKSRPENGGTTKHTTHRDAKVSSEANEKCIQQDNATCDIGIVENLNHSSKFTGAIRKPPAQSKLPDIKPVTIRSGNVTSPDDKGYSHETFETAPYWSQAVAQRRLGENTDRTFDSKIYVNSQLDSKIFNVRALDFETKSNACNDKAMKNNVAGPLLVQTHKGSEYKCGRANNRVTKICTTRKNCRNELYIDRKNMREFLGLLECPVCYQRIRGEIQKCIVGHFICVECRSRLDRDRCPVCQSVMSQERMVTLENMIKIISMKCPYEKYGCRHAVNPIRMPQHMEKCPYRVISCVDAKCPWEGKLEHIIFHFAKEHNENIALNTGELSARSLERDYTHDTLIRLRYLHNFLCRFKVCNATNTVSIAVQHLPTLRNKDTEWRYRLTLSSGIKQTMYCDLKVHEFKDTDSLNCADKSLILPIHEMELFEVDGSIKYKIWLTKSREDTPTSTVDGYCDVGNTPGKRKA